MRYVPEGMYTTAGVSVDESHTQGPQRFPSLIARLIASESSVTPSPYKVSYVSVQVAEYSPLAP